jgi:pyruvate dehydrogenase E1 component
MAFVRLRDLMKDPGDGAEVRADHPGRGQDVRHGLALPDREDLLAARPVHGGSGSTPLSYKESERSQILHKGIEAGAIASTVAAGTAYATHGTP